MRILGLGLAALMLSMTLCGGSAYAEDKDGKVLEHLTEGLKLRIEARMKRAALLADLGRKDEALRVYESVEGLYEEGIKELRAMLRGPAVARVEPRLGGGIAPRTRSEDERRLARVRPTAGTARPLRDPPSDWSAPRQAKAIDAAINAGLKWLATHQAEDGNWDAHAFSMWRNGSRNPQGRIGDDAGLAVYNPGVTALSLLAFFSAGHSHVESGPHQKVIAKGLKYLRGLQDREGCFGTRSLPNYIYNHAMCTLAMVQAYAQSDDERLKPSAQKALDFSAFARNPYLGWRYGVKPGDNDTSVTHWMLLGLHTAQSLNKDKLARGKDAPFVVDEGAFQGALAWVEKMTDPDFGSVGYIARGSSVARPRALVDAFPAEKSEAMTAAGISIRMMCGQTAKANALVLKGAERLRKLPPNWNPKDGSIDTYYWYLGTLAMFQVGGKHWRHWAEGLIDATLPRQVGAGSPPVHLGSWDPLGPWAADGGRVYSTALHIQMLAVLQAALSDSGN